MKYFAVAVVCLVVILTFVVILLHMPQQPNTALPTATVTIGTTTIVAEVASTDAEREQGLSGRASLPPNEGMLFVFQTPGRYGFWMKDMQFSLDMLFAASDGTVVTIDPNLSPQSYEQNPPEVFYPDAPVSYVLEVPAGFAAAHNIALGSKLVVQ